MKRCQGRVLKRRIFRKLRSEEKGLIKDRIKRINLPWHVPYHATLKVSVYA